MALDNQELIAQIAAQKLGPAQGQAPAQMAPPQGQAPQAPAAPTAPPKADPAPTNMEKAQSKIAPTDPQQQPAKAEVQFIKLGEKEYTDSQLQGMMGRYKDLNYKHAQNKPVMDVIEQIITSAKNSGYDAKPDEVAGLVEASMRAYLKNPQMGQQKSKDSESKQQAKQPMSSDGDEVETDNDPDGMYEQWEKENAVKLPPGFRETAKSSKEMGKKLDDMMAMFQQVIQGGLDGGQAKQEAGQQVQQAQTMQADAANKMISNNLNQSFQQAGIGTDPQTRSDFRMFAAQRGYDFPDFMDAGLTATVVADYKANKDAPEVQRLREIAQKRQAFTGMVEGAPGAAGGSPKAPADPMLASMIGTAMKNRNM